jgi:penicillin-binding protein 2
MQGRLQPFQGSRLVFFSVVMIAMFTVLVIRMAELQFSQYDSFVAAAVENSVQSVPLPATRGEIFDRNGIPLAQNAPAFNVSIIPANLPEDEDASLEVLNRLSALIDVPATREAADAAGEFNVRSLDELVTEGNNIAPYRAVTVATDVDPEVARIILETRQNLPGVNVFSAAVREYPTGELTSQIIGYLGPVGADEAESLREQGYDPRFERIGYAGVEGFLDTDLAGVRGSLRQTVDVAGLPINVISRQEPVSGRSVRLTLDMPLQTVAQQALRERINLINARERFAKTTSGVVIAMDVRTGEVLAMVSLPTYDNTRFARGIDAEYYLRILNEPQTPLQNHAIGGLYPPGSVWKLLTAAAVLNEDVIDPNAQLVDQGEMFIENRFGTFDDGSRQRFVCWLRPGGHGPVNMVQAIAWSCDIYFYQVGGGNPDEDLSAVLRTGGLGIDQLVRYSTAFGIGVQMGIELPAEAGGRMPDPNWKRRNQGESWSTGDTYNAAFGQGYVTTTPLQLLNSSVALINGGVLYQPTIINSWVDSEGNIVEPFQSHIMRTIAMPTDGSPVVLNLREDLYIRQKQSLACTCEQNTPFRDPENERYYDPNMPECTQELIDNYQGEFTTPEGQTIPYRVNVPYGYTFRSMCTAGGVIRMEENRNYQPPFVRPENIRLVQEGMLGAVMMEGGTAQGAALDYVQVAGKTGTAEYCDDIARALLLCVPGAWPTHAWYVGYAPYDNPEIAVIAFVYNGGEGSGNALPIVRDVIDCYFKVKSARAVGAPVPVCQTNQRAPQ